MPGRVKKLLRLGRRKAREWDLVLQAMGIPHRLQNTADGIKIRVAPSRQKEAALQIKFYERENADSYPVRVVPKAVTALIPSLIVFLAIYLFHFYISFINQNIPFRNLGAAESVSILSGEWWRLITALTLHADLGHVLSNCILLAIFGSALGGMLGSGTAYSLILASGIGGTWVNALVHQSGHSSIGASTTVFGAIGILSALQISPRFKNLPGGALGPFAAAVGLLALLGMSGQQTDIGGHVFGFLCGTLLGLAAGFTLPQNKASWPIQGLLGLASAVLIVSAWQMAI